MKTGSLSVRLGSELVKYINEISESEDRRKNSIFIDALDYAIMYGFRGKVRIEEIIELTITTHPVRLNIPIDVIEIVKELAIEEKLTVTDLVTYALINYMYENGYRCG